MADDQSTVERVEIQVEIDIAHLDLDDFLLIADLRSGKNLNPIDIVQLLDHVIVGGIRGKHYPQDAIEQLFNAIVQAIERMANPTDARGKA